MKAFWENLSNLSRSRWPCWQSSPGDASAQRRPKRAAELEVAPRVPMDRVTGQAASARESQELRQAIAESMRMSSSASPSEPSQPSRAPAQRRRQPDQTAEAEALALEQLNLIVGNCAESNAQFIDPEFAPSTKALYSNGRCRRREAENLLIVQHYEKTGREVQWRRPGEILQRPDDLMMEFESREEMIVTMHQIAKMIEWKVFQSGSDPKPTDISQGALGNCWFCGSLAAVAEKPRLVKRLFVDGCSKRGELSPVGVYLIRLCDGGEWRFVVLDDHFPCNSANMLAYSGARRNQLWVPLVEKAFAKLRGCYEETEGGSPSEGLRLLTGWPSVVLHLQASESEDSQPHLTRHRSEGAMTVQASCPFQDEELLWARLVSACSADLIMCGSCGHVEGISKEQYRNAGLSPSHCYSIVQVAAARGGALRLIKLRNPWGTGLKWKGDFSDGDTKWTPELKSEVGATDLGQDGGIFWMTLQDLRRHFNSITICPYREGWSEFRATAALPEAVQGPQPGVFLGKPANGQPTEALLTLMQPEERQTATTMTADLGLALFRVPAGEDPGADGRPYGASAGTRGKLQFIDSTPRQVHDSLLQERFLEGREGGGVLAVPLSFNQRVPVSAACEAGSLGSGPKPFTFCCFSAREVPARSLQLAPELVRSALVAHIKHHGSIGSQNSSVRLWKLAESGLMVYVENVSMNFVEVGVELSELFNMTVSRGVEVDATGQLTMKTRDMIPPLHGMVVFVAAAMPAGHTYRFSSRFIPRMDMDGGLAHNPPLASPQDPLHDPFFLDGPSDQQSASAGRRPFR